MEHDEIEKLTAAFMAHTQEDIKQFSAVRDEAHRESDAIHARLDGIATKKDIEELTKKIEPVLEVYRAVILSRGFITGLAGVVVAITAIGVGISWFINS